jgi:serine/threonine protein kinase
MDAPRKLVFKYNLVETNIFLIWHEINCLMRIPRHPNIVPLESLVVDTTNGRDVVVGYTTAFVPGDTVEANVGRVFKLKYLEQLLCAIDFLNLELGIVHGDIFLHNLLINPETDSLQIFDFNLAAKLGWKGEARPGMRSVFAYDEERNDVKNAVFTLYEAITRDMHFREEKYPEELDASMVADMEVWGKHDEVNLDADVAKYRAILDEWVKSRKEPGRNPSHWTEALRPLDWPRVPDLPEADWCGLPIFGFQYRNRIKRDRGDYLTWQRLPSSQLPLP